MGVSPGSAVCGVCAVTRRTPYQDCMSDGGSVFWSSRNDRGSDPHEDWPSFLPSSVPVLPVKGWLGLAHSPGPSFDGSGRGKANNLQLTSLLQFFILQNSTDWALRAFIDKILTAWEAEGMEGEASGCAVPLCALCFLYTSGMSCTLMASSLSLLSLCFSNYSISRKKIQIESKCTWISHLAGLRLSRDTVV